MEVTVHLSGLVPFGCYWRQTMSWSGRPVYMFSGGSVDRLVFHEGFVPRGPDNVIMKESERLGTFITGAWITTGQKDGATSHTADATMDILHERLEGMNALTEMT
ncbi:uncharacterized protein LOC119378479 isoform X2 [Rhipicephalus sanguineus]|uniref:uncharacterized protein LOC119378479 isoform X2 n=1 Tax=Rhipicephalus sanguineus TaxID=34632 RepID=UPI001893FE39|nr:uncharacterized protein LOC119378479 isoform X2 [Rhipicephalus sanguineus]